MLDFLLMLHMVIISKLVLFCSVVLELDKNGSITIRLLLRISEAHFSWYLSG